MTFFSSSAVRNQPPMIVPTGRGSYTAAIKTFHMFTVIKGLVADRRRYMCVWVFTT